MTMPTAFLCEALVSGGPRHKDEVELCEDVAGVVIFPEGAAFYIADATSDEGKIGPFSSHYFANSLGFWFLKQSLAAISNGGSAINLDQVYESALSELKIAWQKELEAFWKKPEADKELNSSAEPFTTKGGSGSLKAFSTTFCGGVVSAKDKTIRLVRTGDIDLIVKHAGEQVQRKPFRKERMFIQFVKKDNEEPKFTLPDLTYEHYSGEDLDYLIVKTDGVSFINDELTCGSLKGCTMDDVLKFRRILLKGVKEASGDDKAMLYCAFLDR